MYIGAIVIATLCRDRRALRACVFGYILVGVFLAIYLFLTSYGALQGATATDFDEASRLRAEVFEENALYANVNSMAFFLAQSAAVTLAIALTSRSAFAHYGLFGVTAVCFIASFLPLSRSGTAITLLACVAVVLAYLGANRRASFRRFIRIIVLMLGLGTCLFAWVPQAVFSRLTVPATRPDGTTDRPNKSVSSRLGPSAGVWADGSWGRQFLGGPLG